MITKADVHEIKWCLYLGLSYLSLEGLTKDSAVLLVVAGWTAWLLCVLTSVYHLVLKRRAEKQEQP